MKKLLKKIESFLAHRSESEHGGYAKVAENDVEDLFDIFSEILKLKYGSDADGDIPVEFRIIDRTKYERLQYFAIPYEHKAKSEDEILRTLSLLSTNLNMAANAVNCHVKLMEITRRHEKEKAEKK
jgi:hypothetical protein